MGFGIWLGSNVSWQVCRIPISKSGWGLRPARVPCEFVCTFRFVACGLGIGICCLCGLAWLVLNFLISPVCALQALQVKFAWALTCHKAQGGQWPAVIVDQGYLQEDMVQVELLRWFYTAFTRSQEKLFLLNFSDSFFSPPSD